MTITMERRGGNNRVYCGSAPAIRGLEGTVVDGIPRSWVTDTFGGTSCGIRVEMDHKRYARIKDKIINALNELIPNSNIAHAFRRHDPRGFAEIGIDGWNREQRDTVITGLKRIARRFRDSKQAQDSSVPLRT